MTKSKLPDSIRKKNSITFLLSDNEMKYIPNYNKSDFIRIILFELMPKLVNKFVEEGMQMDMTTEEQLIIKKYIELNK